MLQPACWRCQACSGVRSPAAVLYCAPFHTRTPQHSTAPCCPLLYWAVSWGTRETRRLTGRMAGSYWGQSHI